MGNFGLRPAEKSWLSVLTVAATLAPGVAVAQQIPITARITIQPIDVCSSTGALCAPFNMLSRVGNPNNQDQTANPVGFVDPTGINFARAAWNRIGIDLTFLPILQYKSAINPNNNMNFQTLNITQDNSTCGLTGAPTTGYQSCDFLTLSQQPAISKGTAPNPIFPNAPVSSTSTVLNMFFVTTLKPPTSQAGSQLYGFSWLGNNGIAIGSNTFFPPSPLPPRPDTMAHEIGHNLGLDHITFGAGPNPVTGACNANYPACMANLMTTGGTPAGNLRSEPPVTGTGSTTKVPLAPLTNGTADQLNTETQEDPAALPISQQREVLSASGFLIPVANYMTIAAQPASSGASAGSIVNTASALRAAAGSKTSPASTSITFDVTGGTGGSSRETLLTWVLTLPTGLKFDSHNQFRITPQSQVKGIQDADYHPDEDNAGNGPYLLPSSLYNTCAPASAQCLIVEFNVPGLAAGASIEFTQGITNHGSPVSLDELACGVNPPTGTCKGAQVTFIFTDGYATTSALIPEGSGQLVAGSQFPDPRAPSQVTSPNTVTGSGNMPCTPIINQFGMLSCLDPGRTGVSDGDASQEGGQCSAVPGGCTASGG
jgi:hypothetical protein